MKHEIHSAHRLQNAVVVPHIAQIETDRAVSQPVAHIVLLLLVPAENTNLAKTNLSSHIDHCVAKGSCPSGDQKGLVIEDFCLLLRCHASSRMNYDLILLNSIMDPFSISASAAYRKLDCNRPAI